MMDSSKDAQVDQIDRIRTNLPELSVFKVVTNDNQSTESSPKPDCKQDDLVKERERVKDDVEGESIGEPKTRSRLSSSFSSEFNSSEYELEDSELETSLTSSEPSSLPGLVPSPQLPSPDPSMLCIIVSKGVPENLANVALQVTRNRSVAEAIHWINNIHDDDEEEEGMNLDDIVLVLIVNSSLAMSPGRMYVEGARAVARLSLMVKDEFGLEMLELVDQGSSEVRLATDSRHMEDVMETIEMSRMDGMSNYLTASFSRDSMTDDEEVSDKYVMAIFGDAADIEELVGSLPLMIN